MLVLKNFIDGQWVPSSSSHNQAVFNPASEEELAQVPLGCAEDVHKAVAAAKKAFPQWRRTPVTERISYLFRLKPLLEEHSEELATLITTEHGKTLAEARASLRRGIQMVETATSVPSLMMGSYFEDVARGIDITSVQRPMGVFCAITPFNFPAMIPFWFWPFAIACGNTFILKPSERTPLTSQRVGELLETLNLPKGVFNLVHGGKEVAEALCKHEDVKGVSFVGSTPVARHIHRLASEHGKRVQALGGAKNVMVALPDLLSSKDRTDSSIALTFESITGCAGERCMAGSLVLCVGDEIYEVFKKGLTHKAKTLTVGPGLDPKTDMGPVISKEAKGRIEGLIQRAIQEGATVLEDGRGKGKGLFLHPTVLGDIKPQWEIAQVEIFGPVILLGKVSSLEEAIHWINSLPFANTTTLLTTSGSAARQFAYEVDPTMIGINLGVPVPVSFFSFGGSKDSFFGDIKAYGRQSTLFYTETCTTMARWV